MTEDVLTPKRILDAAEDVLCRFGPGKAKIVDVARPLDLVLPPAAPCRHCC